ncbi:type VII secretion protein EccB [Actinospica robiniae]|uniref:type VII secretion protein EccB n=1 Tax=Actinospica robiniae TaxID=304901 RepID=UPI000418BA5C|nr:type VII secretion protein EccB [Actinospica robiniae]
MATRKDQLDAFNFARRRMVANLVVPTATGSDEGAPRPVKTFATSIILSAIAVAAVAVIGVFKPAAPSGWQNGLAVDESTGAAYIYTKSNNQLHSVYNITSARLILGSNFAKYDVPDSTINNSGITIGSPVGILGAPEDVPSASNMNLTQWSLCQNEKDPNNESLPGGSTYLQIGYGPSAQTAVWNATSHEGIIVHDSQDDVYLIDGDYKYEVGNYTDDAQNVANLLSGLQSDQYWTAGDGFWVSDAWLSVFTSGAQITAPALLSGVGDPVTGAGQIGQHVGDYGLNYAGGGGSVQTADGLLELTPFEYYLYATNSALSGHVANIDSNKLTAIAIEGANAHGAPKASDLLASNTLGADWPTIEPSLDSDAKLATSQNLCVGYDGAYDGGGKVPQLTTWLYQSLPYGSPGGQFGLNQVGNNNEANNVVVRPGYGLVARRLTGDFNSGGKEFLIEDSDYRYELVDVKAASTSSSSSSPSSTQTDQSAKTLLGYGEVADEQLPEVWVNLMQGGAPLDPTAAGTTPGNGQ